LALVISKNRIYGVDKEGGIYHEHPLDNPETHIPLQKGISLEEFILKSIDILKNLGILYSAKNDGMHEFTGLTEAKEVIGNWVEKYNQEYVHSALGYLSPLEFEQKFYQNYCQEAA